MNYVSAAELLPYMSERAKSRALAEMPGLAGVFCFAFPYFAGAAPGNISLYARGADYHAVVGARLSEHFAELSQKYPAYRFRSYADASPYPEVLACARAGVGVIGKNGLLITEKYGSFVFLGLIATDMPQQEGSKPAFCENCGRCEKACPAGAISGGRVDKDKCLSAITQKKGPLISVEARLLAACGSAWGCDACQTACPHNENPQKTDIPEFLRELVCSLCEQDLPENEAEFAEKYGGRAFAWRGLSPLKRNLEILKK